MVNYDYKKFLQENKQCSYQNVLDSYSYHDDVSAFIYQKINNLDSFDEEEMKSIINLITLWKVDRINGSTNDTLKSLFGWIRNVSLKTENDDVKFVIFDASSNKEIDVETKLNELIQKMLEADGVGLPMASTMLRFFNTHVFQIIDHRDFRSLYALYKNERRELNLSSSKKPEIIEQQAELYLNFLKDCKLYCSANRQQFEKADRYLYQLDIKVGNKVNYKKEELSKRYQVENKNQYLLLKDK